MKRVKYIAQIQQTECGLSVIAMILNYYGAHYSLHDIRQFMKIGRDGMSAGEVMDILSKFGVETEAYRCNDIKLLGQISVPFIIIEEKKHFVIIEKVTQKLIYVVDPEIGHIKYSYDEFIEKFDGIFINVKPGKDFEKKKKEHRMLKFLFPIIAENRKNYLIFALMSVLNYIIMLAFPVSIQKLIDGISDRSALLSLELKVMIISVLYIFSNLLLKFSITKLKIKLDKRVNREVISHMLKLPYLFFDTRKKSDIIYTLNHIASVKDVIVTDLLGLFLNVGVLVVIWGYFFSSDVVIALLLGIALIPNIILSILSQKVMVRNMRKLVAENSRVQGYQTEILYAVSSIKTGAEEDSVLCEWQEKYDKYCKKYGINERISAAWSILLSMSRTLSPVFVLIIGIIISQNNLVSIGKIIAFLSLAEIFFAQVYSFFNSLLAININYVYVERLEDILFEKEFDTAASGAESVKNIETIEVKNISFRYTEQTGYIIKNISFNINKGEIAAIVGKSGSGKSTLLKVISGLYEASDGELLINGKIKRNIEKKSLAKQIGIVPQDSYLFNKTIYDNIVRDNKDITTKEIDEVLKLVNIYDDIMKMPMGLNTIISEMGMNLSGGQRQRIVLAKELIKKPSVLVLDEATSALDYINEKEIIEKISRLNITIIIVTHRLSSIQNADRIIFMDGGTIVEEGTHKILMEKEGFYYKMWNDV